MDILLIFGIGVPFILLGVTMCSATGNPLVSNGVLYTAWGIYIAALLACCVWLP
jgi:hypothetical protein